MFQNDWMVANLANPDFDVDDMVSIGGISTDNTQFLSKNEYLKSSFIRDNDLFKDEDGNFSMSKFDDYYNTQAAKWRDLQENDYPQGLALDPFDTAANRKNAKIKDTKVRVGINYNPDRQQMGIEGFRTISDRTKTQAEIAQSQKIFDYELGEYKDVTPEDSALSVSPIKWIQQLFSEPLVLAQYDEDTIDEYGMEHKKGDYKLNKEGTYYYETLAGRSPLNRSVLSAADILTPENSALNSIDFFDSDDIKKSTAGVVAKTVATIAPMFTPIAPIYYWGIVAKELVKTLPMIHGVVTNLFGDGDNETPEWMNNLAAWGEQATMGTSEYAKKSTFCTENFINLISDVALQWGQQKAITKGMAKLLDKGELKNAEKRAFAFYKQKVKEGGRLKGLEAVDETKWKDSILGQMSLKKFYEPAVESMRKKQQLGADLSLVYMALISNTDVYEDMLERGGTKQEAAWIALGSTAGMFSVDKFLHLGELFFDDLTADAVKQSRKVINGEITDALNTFYGRVKGGEKWYKVGFDLGKKAANTFVQNIKNHNLGAVGKALGEGIEEVSEEVVTDLSKSTYSLLGDLGLYDKHIEDTGAFDNMLERYGMSLIGGAIGGGLFYGVEKFQGNYNKVQDKDLTDLINDGKADIVRKQVKEMAAKGQIASKTLSGTKYTTSSDGKITWLSADNDADSQNQQIANRILEKVDAIEAAIVGSKTQMSHDQLFDNMVMQEVRYLQYKNASNVTGYYQEFSKLQSQYIEDYLKYQAALNPTTDTADQTQPTDKQKREGTDEAKKQKQQQQQEQLQNLKDKVDEDKKKMDKFLSGDTSFDYTRKLLFAMDPYLNKAFMHIDFDKWIAEQPIPTTEVEFLELQGKWEKHMQDSMAQNLDKAYEVFKTIEKQLAPLLKDKLSEASQYKAQAELLDKLRNSKEDLSRDGYFTNHPLPKWDDKFVINGVEESEEDYNSRNDQSTPDKQLAVAKRMQNYRDLIHQAYQGYVDEILKIIGPKYELDAATNRALQQYIGIRLKESLALEMSIPGIYNGHVFDPAAYQDIAKKVNNDFTNLQELEDAIGTRFYQIKSAKISQDMATIWSRLIGIKNLNAKEVFNNLEKIIDNIKNNSLDYAEFIAALGDTSITNKNQLIDKLIGLKANFENADNPLFADEFTDPGWDFANDNIKYIPDQFKMGEANFKDFFKNFASMFEGKTIADIKGDLINPDSDLYKKIIAEYQNGAGLAATLLANLNNAKNINDDLDAKVLLGETTGKELKNLVTTGSSVEQEYQEVQDWFSDVRSSMDNNPIALFQQTLRTESHSPLEIILKAIGKDIATDDNELFNINYILDMIYKHYTDVDNIADFKISEDQGNLLDKARQTLEMMSAYIYAASKGSGSRPYFYQNKQVNDFARSHKDEITEKWDELPELDEDFGMLLQQEVVNLQKEINIWERIFEFNSMNKTRRMANADYNTSKLRYKIAKGITYKFTIDNKDYDLSEGMDSLPDNIGEEDYLNSLYQIEQTIYNNAQKIINDPAIGAKKFWDAVWKQVFPTLKSMTNFEMQRVSKYSENTESLTDYDKAMYLLSIISENPENYYKGLQGFVKDHDKIAPFTVQQIGAQIGEAATSSTFKAGLRSLYEATGTNINFIQNMINIDGIAGAGKTDVVMRAIRHYFKDKQVLVVGPKATQAKTLAEVMGEATYYTNSDYNNIFEHLFENWKEIKADYGKAFSKLEDNLATYKKMTSNITDYTGVDPVKTDFFTLRYVKNKNGYSNIVKVDIKKDKLKYTSEKAQLIFVDEAAHFNTALMMLLDAYADHVGGTIIAASDSDQSGTSDKVDIQPQSVFIARAPRQMESIRTTNIQKQENTNKVFQLIDLIKDTLSNGDTSEMVVLREKLKGLMGNLNLRVYNENDDINGDLFNADADRAIEIIKKQGNVTVGYIGDANSEKFQKFKAAGLVSEALTLESMQGQEFDYVFVDDTINLSANKLSAGKLMDYFAYMQKFGTLMSRGKKATLFAHKGLDKVFGGNKFDKLKSKGFDILQQVPVFREAFLRQLGAIKFKSEATNTEVKPDSSTSTPTSNTLTNTTPTVDNSSEGSSTSTADGNPDTGTNPDESSIDSDESEESTETSSGSEENDSSEEGVESTEDAESKEDTNSENTEEESTSDEDINEEENSESEEKSSEEVSPSNEVIVDNVDINAEKEQIPEIDPNSTEGEVKKLEEKNIKEREDLTNDTIDESPSLSVNPEMQLLIDANTMHPLIGLQREQANNGRWIWKANSEKGTIRRNLAALYLNPRDLETYKEKRQAQNMISDIQNALAYDHDIKNSELLSNSSFMGAWRNKTMIFSIRRAEDTDYFGINTDLKNTFIEIDGIKYVVSLAVKLEGLRDGENTFTGIIDLALLANPNSLSNTEKQRQIKEIAERVLKSNASDSVKAKAKNNIDHIEDIAKDYSKFLEKLINEGTTEITLTPEMYEAQRATYLSKRTAPRRLGGVYNIDVQTGNIVQDNNSFLYNNDVVHSPVYILTKAGEDIFPKSAIGKAVIFVSGNKNLASKDLANLYIQQKRYPTNHTPEVRMVVLRNHGLSFSEIVTKQIWNLTKGESNDDSDGLSSPYDMRVLGLRMYTTMWDARAALINFNSQLQKWKNKHRYNDSFVEKLTQAEKVLYDQFKSEKILPSNDSVKNTLNSYQVTWQDIENLKDFNNKYCKDIPMFRLGYTTTITDSYIRNFDISGSTVYPSKRTANLVVISEKTASKYKRMLDAIFKQLQNTDTPIDWDTKERFTPIAAVIKKFDGTSFRDNEYISDLGNGTLKGRLHTRNKQVTIDGCNINSQQSFWSFVPRLLTRMVGAATYKSNTDNLEDVIGWTKMRTIDSSNNEGYAAFEIGELLQEMTTTPGVTDTSLFTLMNLIFHGSAEDLNKEGRVYSSVAPFKWGFKIDPKAKIGNPEEFNIGPVKDDDGTHWMLIQCDIPLEFFDVDVDTKFGGWVMNLDMLKDNYKVKENNPTTVTPSNSDISNEYYKDDNFNEEEVWNNQCEIYSGDLQRFRLQQIINFINSPQDYLNSYILSILSKFRKEGYQIEDGKITKGNLILQVNNSGDEIIVVGLEDQSIEPWRKTLNTLKTLGNYNELLKEVNSEEDFKNWLSSNKIWRSDGDTISFKLMEDLKSLNKC